MVNASHAKKHTPQRGSQLILSSIMRVVKQGVFAMSNNSLTLPTKAAEYLRESAPLFAKAKSDRIFLEQFRKSKKALLMAESTERTAAAKEIYAYAHHEYIELLNGLREAVEAEEIIKWKMTAAEAHIEIWRTESANNRQIDRTHR